MSDQNRKTEKLAKKAVVLYEEKHHRKILNKEKIRGQGYDLVTEEATGKKRFIEIKSTAKDFHKQRWLEQRQFKRMQSEDNYWIYLVLSVTTKSAKIRPVPKKDWPSKPKRKEIKRWYEISDELQKDAEEISIEQI
jgi:Protein NO VEIN, C-terminal